MCTNRFGYRPCYLRLPIVRMALIPALWGPRLTSRESPCSVIPEINAHRTQILNKESYIQVPIITTRDRKVKFTRQGLRPNHTNTLIAEIIGLSGCPCIKPTPTSILTQKRPSSQGCRRRHTHLQTPVLPCLVNNITSGKPMSTLNVLVNSP